MPDPDLFSKRWRTKEKINILIDVLQTTQEVMEGTLKRSKAWKKRWSKYVAEYSKSVSEDIETYL